MLTAAQRAALEILAETLRHADVFFQVTGGLAAKAYGATRPLYDIDIEVHAADIPRVRETLRKFIVKDFFRLDDEYFDLRMLTLNVHGVPVDINQVEETFVKTTGGRVRVDADLARAEERSIDGIVVPVQPRDDLIAYKRLLARPTDLQDIAEMEAPE